jgi:hypothetical protein
MPSDWNQVPAFGRKRGAGDPGGFTPASPLPRPFGQRDPERARLQPEPAAAAGGFARTPIRSGIVEEAEGAGNPGLFGRSTCCLTYRGSVAPEAVLPMLTPALLGGRLTGRVTGNPRSGYMLLPMKSGGVAVSVTPAPLKLSEEDPAQYAAWPNWRAEVAEWGSHVSIVAFGEARSPETARDCAEDVVFLAGRLGRLTGAAAAVWQASGSTMPAPVLARQAERTALPIELLVRCLARNGAGPATARTGVTTRGLHLFGLPEIDHPPGGDPIVKVCERVLALAANLLARGEAPEDGLLVLDELIGYRVRPANDVDGLPALVLVPPAG